MARQVWRLEREKLSCSICLDLLQVPVTIPCGHSYCMSCIENYWDTDGGKWHRCPQCQQSFTPRPVLVKNTMFAEVVEELKKAELPATPPEHFYAGPGDVACDFCSGRRLKASKSCLVCVASYCDLHLQPHLNVAPLKKHKLVQATSKLQECFCAQHDEVMKIYCRTDHKCICYLCSMGEHKGHNIVPTATERADRQVELTKNRQIYQQRIRDGEKDEKMLQKEVEAVNNSADRAVEDCEKMVKELIGLIEKKSSEVTQKIRHLQNADVCHVQELQRKLQQEITELRRKDAELELLSSTEDHLHFILSCPPPAPVGAATNSPTLSLQSHRHIGEATQAVLTMRDLMRTAVCEQWERSSVGGTAVDVQEPKTRCDFLKYAREISLDPNTANQFLALSENNRRATLMGEPQVVYPHPDRFRKWWQVLGSEGLTGRCYWEVRWSGAVLIAVAYRDISRGETKSKSAFGHNKMSWALQRFSSGFTFSHDDTSTPLSGPRAQRVGVYLDHGAGTLSFYSITDTMTLLHRVQTTFTQPLYPGFWLLNEGNYAELQYSV